MAKIRWSWGGRLTYFLDNIKAKKQPFGPECWDEDRIKRRRDATARYCPFGYHIDGWLFPCATSEQAIQSIDQDNYSRAQMSMRAGLPHQDTADSMIQEVHIEGASSLS